MLEKYGSLDNMITETIVDKLAEKVNLALGKRLTLLAKEGVEIQNLSIWTPAPPPHEGSRTSLI